MEGDFFPGFNIALRGHRDQDKHHLARCFLNALCVPPAANDVWWGRPLRLAGGRSLGVSPGSGPGLMTEQSTKGIGLGKAFLDSREWAYRLRAGNSFDCMLWGFPDFMDSQGPRGVGLPASPQGSEVPFSPGKSLSSPGNPTSFVLFQSILFWAFLRWLWIFLIFLWMSFNFFIFLSFCWISFNRMLSS